MFWIAGGGSLDAALKAYGGTPACGFLSNQLTHVKWAGFHFIDLVFPMFVFIAGVSLAWSLPPKIGKLGRAATARRLVLRAAILFFIGVLFSGGVSKGFDQIRWLGVLQRIALASLGAGLLSMWLGVRGLVATCAALLIGYWGLLAFVAPPGGAAGDFREGHNIVNWLDAHFLAGRKYDGDHDPEGILSTIPAIGNCLLGLLAGIFLRNANATANRKALTLVIAGAVLVVVGLGWGVVFPVIKKLWTSSFVLVACGLSAMLLGIFHHIIEVRNLRSWAVPFVWIGLNPITIYLAGNIVNFDKLADRFTGPSPGVAHAVVATGFGVLLAWWLHRRRIYLRV